MKFLDINGVTTLWNKIKDYIGTETKKYLPLDEGGVVTSKLGARGKYTGTYKGNSVTFETNAVTNTGVSPFKIQYSYNNISIYIKQDNVEHVYKLALEKLIADGYLVEQ